jgi:hypothetical protein
MTEDAVCVGVDVAKSTLGVAVSGCEETRHFANDHEGISQAVRHISGLKPAGIIVEATDNLEMPLAAVRKPEGSTSIGRSSNRSGRGYRRSALMEY